MNTSELPQVKQSLFPSGHQLQSDQRAVNACKTSLEEAFGHITRIQSTEIQVLATKIAGLIARSCEISYAMDEAYNQNV